MKNILLTALLLGITTLWSNTSIADPSSGKTIANTNDDNIVWLSCKINSIAYYMNYPPRRMFVDTIIVIDKNALKMFDYVESKHALEATASGVVISTDDISWRHDHEVVMLPNGPVTKTESGSINRKTMAYIDKIEVLDAKLSTTNPITNQLTGTCAVTTPKPVNAGQSESNKF